MTRATINFWTAIFAVLLVTATGAPALQVKSPVVGVATSGYGDAPASGNDTINTATGAPIAAGGNPLLITKVCITTGSAGNDVSLRVGSADGQSLFFVENQVNTGCYDFAPGLVAPAGQPIRVVCGPANGCSATVVGILTKAPTP